MTRRFGLNKTLLYKEWRDHRFLFLVYFCLISIPAITYPIIFWLTLPTKYNELDWTQMTWLRDAQQMLSGGEPFSIIISIFIAIGVGAMMLTNDRVTNTLEFLAALPVSRREIVTAKYAVGTLFFLVTVALNVLALLFWKLLFGDVRYEAVEAVEWGVQFAGVLLALYSVSFLMSTIAGNRMAAGMLGLTATLGLHVFIGVLDEAITPNFPYEKSWLQHLSLLNYLPSVSHPFGNEQPYLIFLGLAAFSLLCWFLSVKLFQSNPFENHGRFLVYKRLTLPMIALFVISLFLWFSR
ncbi:ABC-2 family transporter [Tumebacillus sp. BK434]|uniref:ABC transporter permease n=1 Tax=Tumebacillus sp. BK434 TaxID=2512169 RepID=UPI0010EA10E0|nr:ABC transporter permease subunit [Tumebacillus sp. BK434]TCP52537.1 ABC-2 family transporter [Tumebacillus sp. BK434]